MDSHAAGPRAKKAKLDKASRAVKAATSENVENGEKVKKSTKIKTKKANGIEYTEKMDKMDTSETKAKSKRPIEEDEGEDEVDETAAAELEEKDVGEATEEKAPAEEELPTTFKELGLVDVLCEICATLKFSKPTPIQAKAVPVALQNRDVIGTAETGSGKTLAFALPILQALLDKPRPFFGLVMAPTRELAVQIGQTFEAFSSIALRCAVIVGGMDMVPQTIALGKRPHIIVATPGRLLDHLESTKGFSLKSLRYLVIDEADRLLDMDFGPTLETILKHLPRERRTMLFSATMSKKVESLQRASLRDPVRVTATSPGAAGPDGQQMVATLKQSMHLVPYPKKDTALVYLINEYSGRSVIVFTRTVYETHRVAFLLRALGFGAIPLNGKLSQSARLAALNKIKSGDRGILVATDIAARGLDIPRISIVINYDVPQDSKTYVHRVGRTARAGKSGHAINLVTQYDVQHFLAIEKAIGMERQIRPLPVDNEEMDVFRPRVEEAQRHAKAEMRTWQEQQANHGRRSGGRPRNNGSGVMGGRSRDDDMDRGEL
ncbi:ATP-dependent RNA helicase DDX47/RRP3 [Sporothrix brasiliensis 5110]|uniref:ATP-dependent rRNA helicase RRP3 n=1 Tax=Sporothrix brasiliensis 5110 TaxID=1398154 RepID=A0A0C2EWB6_9PEZI|nr:ATP-dependent RNA helicase DDX47/RRP3 [Sporothrix brasiliensis 5110]KIH90869.1 ATP-dependent RNA helicase DDX47/RRP3 [Sporothrix brasiliensis 5110]